MVGVLNGFSIKFTLFYPYASSKLVKVIWRVITIYAFVLNFKFRREQLRICDEK